MEDHIKNFIIIFTSILYEALPFIILGAVIAGMLEELVPQKLVARVIPRSRVLAIAIGGLLGLVFPMCECGIIPIMRRLLRKGIPLSVCVCYMLAGPIINPVVMLSTYAAFSGETGEDATGGRQIGSIGMMCLRVGIGFLVAFGTSLIVEWRYRKHGDSLLTPLARPHPKPASANNGANDLEEAPRPIVKRISNIAETALHDFIDITVFLILGALLAALGHYFFPKETVEEWSRSLPMASIAIMMGFAIILCLCSEADAFVAASYITLRPASKLAFLVLGPMLDLKLYMMYTRIFRPRLIWTIIPAVVIQVFLYTTALHFIWETYGPYWTSGSVSP